MLTKQNIYFAISKGIKTIPFCEPYLKIKNIYLIRFNKIFKCLFGQKSRLAKSHSVNLNKISEYIGLLFKASLILSRKCLRQLYISYIHSYIIYANIVWAKTSQIKLEKYWRSKNIQFKSYLM